MTTAKAEQRCQLLKLHGSVDWKLVSENPPQVEADKPTFALDCDNAHLAIATPGPSKLKTTAFFSDLWQYACKALKAADVVVFVGYRFPETDAHARGELLSAIRANNAGNPDHHLSLHAVLGGHPEHTARLAALLRHVCRASRSDSGPVNRGRSFRVTPHALFAQDFFSVANTDDLWPGTGSVATLM